MRVFRAINAWGLCGVAGREWVGWAAKWWKQVRWSGGCRGEEKEENGGGSGYDLI